MNWSDIPNDLKARIVKADPANFNAGGIRAVESRQQKPEAGRALEQKPALPKASRLRVATGGPVLRITLISLRNGILDSDSLAWGHWPLRDAIARQFDLDDADSTIEWHYHQLKTTGQQGTLVMIETL